MKFADNYVPRDEQWWRAQIQEVRWTRGVARYDTLASLQMYEGLLNSGLVPVELIDIYSKIVGWGWTPTLVYQNSPGLSLGMLDEMTISSDLVVSSSLLGWSNRPGDGGIRGAVGTTYGSSAADVSPVGATITDGDKFYRKVLTVAQPGVEPTYYTDWSLRGMIPVWLRVPKELL